MLWRRLLPIGVFLGLLALLSTGCSGEAQSSAARPVTQESPSEAYPAPTGERLLVTGETSVARTDLIPMAEARERSSFAFRIPAADEQLLRGSQLVGVLPFDTDGGEGYTAYYDGALILTVEPRKAPLDLEGVLDETYQPDLSETSRQPAYVEVTVGEWSGYGHDVTSQTLRDGTRRSTGSMLSWTEQVGVGFVSYWMSSDVLSLGELQSLAERLR
ncbi:MAG: hypothetical protein RBS17_09500 [Coriobacteriia bacterium]|nr:hypothetical protein [Coriobacteriia bacterium]